jgi:hypothetical protein
MLPTKYKLVLKQAYRTATHKLSRNLCDKDVIINGDLLCCRHVLFWPQATSMFRLKCLKDRNGMFLQKIGAQPKYHTVQQFI